MKTFYLFAFSALLAVCLARPHNCDGGDGEPPRYIQTKHHVGDAHLLKTALFKQPCDGGDNGEGGEPPRQYHLVGDAQHHGSGVIHAARSAPAKLHVARNGPHLLIARL